jgi:type IV fimbrial biogenesis protein FimT
MSRKGVTIIELIVVMVIIAIAAALTIPNIGAWLPNYRLRTAARDIVSTMRAAQMKAVSSNVEYRVKFDAGKASYTLEVRTTEGLDTWMPEGAEQKMPTGIQIHEVNLPGNSAEFNPNSTSSPGNVVLRNSKEVERRIVLYSATGRIRVE